MVVSAQIFCEIVRWLIELDINFRLYIQWRMHVDNARRRWARSDIDASEALRRGGGARVLLYAKRERTRESKRRPGLHNDIDSRARAAWVYRPGRTLAALPPLPEESFQFSIFPYFAAAAADDVSNPLAQTESNASSLDVLFIALSAQRHLEWLNQTISHAFTTTKKFKHHDWKNTRKKNRIVQIYKF